MTGTFAFAGKAPIDALVDPLCLPYISALYSTLFVVRGL
jgi:hypothetical protein